MAREVGATERRGRGVLMLVENSPFPLDPRVRREALALAAAGYRVSVISPTERGFPWHETVEGVQAYRFPAPRPGNGLLGYLWEYGWSMLAIFALSLVVLLRQGFDVIHAANPPDTLVFIGAFYKLLGKQFVYDHHDLAPEMYHARFGNRGKRIVHRSLILLEKLSCRLADHVIATNQSYRAMEMERGGVPESRITIVRNGPDLDRMQPMEPDPVLRGKAPIIIAFAGVMGSQDGVDHLLRALHHLIHDLGRSDFFCAIIGGKGDAQTRLKALARELDLEGHLWFTGWVSDADWVRYLSTADICVDPDPSNPFTDRSTMIKMMEYMAVGKPIVAFDLPEHRYTAGEAAEYVRPNDELEFARALARLMDDPERRQAMGAFGRRRVESELAWSYSARRLLAAYEKLFSKVGPEPRPARGASVDRRPTGGSG